VRQRSKSEIPRIVRLCPANEKRKSCSMREVLISTNRLGNEVENGAGARMSIREASNCRFLVALGSSK
jgi:hypothetical protein